MVRVEKKPAATICVLLYGHYTDLARRCIESVKRFVPNDECVLRIAMNSCCAETLQYVSEIQDSMPVELVIRSDVNIHKYPIMRKLFWDTRIDSDWIIWFDDDTHIISDTWWPGLWQFLDRFPVEAAGKLACWGLLPGEWEFIQKCDWYEGRKPEIVGSSGEYGCCFIVGSYWAIKTECIRILNWPDPRLIAQGGDTLLGSAMWQKGWRQGYHVEGIKAGDAKRRTVTMPRPFAVGEKSSLIAPVPHGEFINPETMSPHERVQHLPEWAGKLIDYGQLVALESRIAMQLGSMTARLKHMASLLRPVLLDFAVEYAKATAESEDTDHGIARRMQREWLKRPEIVEALNLEIASPRDEPDTNEAVDRRNSCEGNLNNCKAKCCKRPMLLTANEIMGGQLEWSIEMPFQVDRAEDGYCIYLDRETFLCTIHDRKPLSCIGYFCNSEQVQAQKKELLFS